MRYGRPDNPLALLDLEPSSAISESQHSFSCRPYGQAAGKLMVAWMAEARDRPAPELIEADADEYDEAAAQECLCIMKRLGLTQPVVAEEVGTSSASVSQWLRGKDTHRPYVQAAGKLMVAWMAEARDRPTPLLQS